MGGNRKSVIRKSYKQMRRRYLACAPVLSEPNSDRLPGQDSESGKSKFTFTKNELLDAAIDLERRSWPTEIQADRESLESRLDTFPSGFIYSVDIETGELAGLSTSMLLKVSNLSELGTWEQITSDGRISSHTSGGNVLYVVSVGVDPELRGDGIGTKLLQAQMSLARAWSVDAMVLCSRLPGLCEYRGTPNEYLLERRKADGLSIDLDVRFYQRNGFQTHSLKPDAMKNDPESRNYGVLMHRPISTKK
jgi:GNAT superfamily N-acetyltransferase